MGKDKKKKKKGGLIGGIVGAVGAILGILLLGMFLVVIILNGIIEMIMAVVDAIIDFLSNPFEFIGNALRVAGNAISNFLNLSYYDPPDTVDNILMPVSLSYIDNMKQSIEAKGVDVDAAGIEDLTLKKMVLTSFKTVATNTTEVAIEATDEEYRQFRSKSSGDNFYRREEEDNDGNKKKYICTQGIVSIQTEISPGRFEEMYCFTQESLDEIEKDYQRAIDDEKSNTQAEIEELLEHSYTVNSIGSIIINARQSTVGFETKELIYERSGEKAAIIGIKDSGASNNLSNLTIDYTTMISEYAMPIEFVSALMELTASPEFSLDVCELVKDSKINLAIYADTVQTDSIIEKKYEVDLEIEGTGSDDYESTIDINNGDVSDISKSMELKREYKGVVVYADTWWCKVKNKVIKNSEETYFGVDADDNEKEVNKSSLNNLWKDLPDETEDYSINKKWSELKNTIQEIFSIAQFMLIRVDDVFEGDYQSLFGNKYVDLVDGTDINYKDFIKKILAVEYSNRDESTKKVVSVEEERSDVRKRQYTAINTVRHIKTAKEVEDNTDKFLKLLKKNNGDDVLYTDYYGDDDVRIGQLLFNGSDVLYEILDSCENTKGISDIMRYIIYRYSGENQGITEFDDLVNIFGSMNSMDGSGFISGSNLMTSYIHSWEGAPPKNADGTKYIVFDDGAGNPTVGWGINISDDANGAAFVAAGYSTNIGAEIDVDFVDKYEEGIMEERIQRVRSTVSGLDLKEYQIHALVSRIYNYNNGLGTYNGIDFVTAYNTYWKDSDDLYGQQEANFNCDLYTKYMHQTTHNNKGEYMAGLENRRKSEWTLFQTGYYDRIGKTYAGGNGDILDAADAVHREEITWTYSVGGDLFWNNIESSINNPNKVTCCATFVSCVIYRTGMYTTAQMNSFNYNSCDPLANFLLSNGWEKISSYDDLQAGDVVFMDYQRNNDLDHVQIYAGDGLWFNAGSTDSIQRASPYSQGATWPKNNFAYAARCN